MLIIGRITKDAVVKQLKDERQVVEFSVAVNDYYKPKNGEAKKFAAYFNCAYWLSSKIAERLKKGTVAEVSGRVYVNAYKDMQGEAKASLNCHVDSIKIHNSMKSDEEKQQPISVEPVADDLPF